MKKSKYQITSIKKFSKTVLLSHNFGELLRNLQMPENGRNRKYVKDMILKYSINISHFNPYFNHRKHKLIEKICPVCENIFTTAIGSRDEKTVCSRSCSNTYFRSGENNGNWNEESVSYRDICFANHKKECIICKEINIVAVHHYDENKDNNLPENLIPLCPTHHTYLHSRYRNLIEKRVEDYRNDFIKKHS